MIVRGLIAILLVLHCQRNTEAFTKRAATQENTENQKVSSFLVEVDGTGPSSLSSERPAEPANSFADFSSTESRYDNEIKKDDTFTGYVYPKPLKPFELPPFTTVDASSHSAVNRLPRSAQRQVYYPPPRFPRPRPQRPIFPPGGRYPGIRPLPALYGKKTFLM